jgi:AcrR family transcriptional regulator
MNRRGVVATVLKDVAAELRVTRMALYRYVADREDLVRQCYLRTCTVLEARLEEAVGGAADAADAISRFIELTLRPGEPELCAIVEPAALGADRQAEVRGRFDDLIARLTQVLAEGAARGQIRPCAFGVAAQAILNVVFWAPVADFWNTAKLNRERPLMLDVTKDFIFHGWAADRRSLPAYESMDLSALTGPALDAFDREGLADARRERILAVASRLFNEKGIDSTTLDDVARELGATSGAISHHVGDKPTLVAECYVRTLRMAIGLQERANAMPGPALRSHAAFQHAWSIAQMRHWPLMPLTGFEALPPSGQRAFHDLVPPLTELTLAHVDAGVADGSMRRLHRYATRLQSGVIGWLSRSGIGDPGEQEMVAREVSNLITVGIRPLG